jgi:hypothetical protein
MLGIEIAAEAPARKRHRPRASLLLPWAPLAAALAIGILIGWGIWGH